MAKNLLVGAHGVKNLVSLGDLDQWMDREIEARQSGRQGADKYFGEVAWLYRAVMLRCEAVAGLPFEIRRGETVIDSSAGYRNALGFLPYPELLFWLMEASACLTGKAYLLPASNRLAKVTGTASELNYASPYTIRPFYDPATGALLYYERKLNGRTVQLAPDEVFAFYYPDPFVEQGAPLNYPARAACMAAGALYHLDAFVEAFFRSGAIKSTLIALGGNPPKTERDRFSDVWRRAMLGVKNMWGNLVVSADSVTATVVGEGVKDLSNRELSDTQRESIAAALSIPNTKLFSGSAAGLGGGGVADADDIRFANEFLIPEWRKFQRFLNNTWAFQKAGLTIHPLYESIDALQVDETERQASATDMVNMINACGTFEIFAFVMGNKGMEYDEAEARAMFAAKEQRAAEAFARQQELVARQAQNQMDENADTPAPGGFQVSRPKPKELEDGKAVSAGKAANTNGVMIALAVPSGAANALATAAAELFDSEAEIVPAEQMHVTLAYVGDVETLNVSRQTLTTLIKVFASEHATINGMIGGVLRFNKTDSEGRSAICALFDSPALPKLYQDLVEILTAAGVAIDKTHGFIPHITLAYSSEQPSEIEIPSLSITFDAVTVAIGGKWEKIPFGNDAAKVAERKQFKRWAAKRSADEWDAFEFKHLDAVEQAALKAEGGAANGDTVEIPFRRLTYQEYFGGHAAVLRSAT